MIDDYLQFIDDKIWEYLPVSKTKTQTEFVVRCPICGDSHKSATKRRGHYYLSSHRYFCFNCNASLSGLKLLEILSGNNFTDIKTEYIKLKFKDIKNFKEEKPLTTTLSVMNITDNIIDKSWKNKLSESAIDYLNHRKVLEAPFLKDKLFTCFDKKQNEYILIPWKINGNEAYYQINDFQRHNIGGPKYLFPKNKTKLLYGLDNIDLSWPYIIVVEGVYDSLFVKNCVCSGGKHLSNIQLNLIKERYPKHQIVMSYDNDKAGLMAMAKTIKLNPTEFKFFKWFDINTKEKDINDFVLANDNVNIFSNKNVLENMIVTAIEMKLFLIQKNMWS